MTTKLEAAVRLKASPELNAWQKSILTLVRKTSAVTRVLEATEADVDAMRPSQMSLLMRDQLALDSQSVLFMAKNSIAVSVKRDQGLVVVFTSLRP